MRNEKVNVLDKKEENEVKITFRMGLCFSFSLFFHSKKLYTLTNKRK